MIGIIGATGRIGRLVITHLVRHGVHPSTVRVIGADRDAAEEARAAGFSLGGDDALGDDDALADGGVRAGLGGVLCLLVVDASSTIVDDAVAAGVRHIVYLSVLRADTSPLATASVHRAMEKSIRDSGVDFTVMRIGGCTETFADAFHQARRTGAIVNAIGRRARISSAAATDYAAAAVAVMIDPRRHAGAVYELAGDSSWTFPAFADVAAEALGRRVEYRPTDLGDDAAADATDAAPGESPDPSLADAIRQGALEERGHDLSRLLGRGTTRLNEVFRLWV